MSDNNVIKLAQHAVESEALALRILSDQNNNYPGENFDGFTTEKFDGKLRIAPGAKPASAPPI